MGGLWAFSRSRLAPLIVVLAGFAVLLVLAFIADREWEQYPIVTLEAEAVDPTELLRGSYVDLAVELKTESGIIQRRVRFFASEGDARAIEGGLRGRKVKLEARRSPGDDLRPMAVIIPDGRRFSTR